MKRLGYLFRRIALIVLIAAIWSGVSALAWAQALEGKPDAEKNYLVPYVLVVLGVGLGVLVVCRPNSRDEKPKWHQEQIGEALERISQRK